MVTLQETDRAKSEKLESMREEFTIKQDHARTANELYAELKDSNSRLRTENNDTRIEVDRLKQDAWNLEADLEECQRAQRSTRREADNLRQQLKAGSTIIEELRATQANDLNDTAQLLRVIAETNATLTENDIQISGLQQENKRLKSQKHFQTFRDHVRLLAKQKACERMVMENQILSEQDSRLTKRLEEAEVQLASQDVSIVA